MFGMQFQNTAASKPNKSGRAMANPRSTGAKQMTLRQFLHDNFGWDIYEWADEEIRF